MSTTRVNNNGRKRKSSKIELSNCTKNKKRKTENVYKTLERRMEEAIALNSLVDLEAVDYHNLSIVWEYCRDILITSMEDVRNIKYSDYFPLFDKMKNLEDITVMGDDSMMFNMLKHLDDIISRCHKLRSFTLKDKSGKVFLHIILKTGREEDGDNKELSNESKRNEVWVYTDWNIVERDRNDTWLDILFDVLNINGEEEEDEEDGDNCVDIFPTPLLMAFSGKKVNYVYREFCGYYCETEDIKSCDFITESWNLNKPFFNRGKVEVDIWTLEEEEDNYADFLEKFVYRNEIHGGVKHLIKCNLLRRQ